MKAQIASMTILFGPFKAVLFFFWTNEAMFLIVLLVCDIFIYL